MTQPYALTGKLAELQGMADTDDEGLKEAYSTPWTRFKASSK